MSEPALPPDSPPSTLEPMPPPVDRPAPGPSRADGEYRPLSVLSLAGFGLAVSYSAVMVVMTLAALVLNKPALVPFWTLLIPLLAIAVCLLGRIEIARAEDTLAGRPLTTWGVALCVVVSLSHFAYMLAVYLALRNQAEAFAQEWMTDLRQGNTSRGALYALPPGQRLGLEEIDDPKILGEEINLRVRNSDKAAPQQFTRTFEQNELVRALAEGGDDTTVTFKGIRSWEYVRNAYEVTLTYRVETPERSFDALVLVRGLEADNDEFRGRQWHVDLRRSGMPRDAETPTTYTPRGDRANELAQGAGLVAQEWQRRLMEYQLAAAYLDTLPPSQREQGRERVAEELSLGAMAGSGWSVTRTDDAGFASFLRGGFLGATERDFADPRRKESLAKVRAAFGLPPYATGGMQFSVETQTPRRAVDPKTGRLTYTYDARYTLSREQMLTGRLVVETDAAALEQPAGTRPQWQIKLVEFSGIEARPDQGPPG